MGPLQMLFGGTVQGKPTPSKSEVIEKLVASLTPDQKEAILRRVYEDYWWQQQPDEVKALRGIRDVEERRMKALELARKGFSIDAAIAVYGMDPLAITELRSSYGFTWVPSVGMSPIQVAPGVEFPGLPKYNPNVVPAGAIVVDKDPRSKVRVHDYFEKFDHAYLLTVAASWGIPL